MFRGEFSDEFIFLLVRLVSRMAGVGPGPAG
jgi:hypothetical protein